MTPSIISSPSISTTSAKGGSGKGTTNVQDALKALIERFVEKNATSLRLHEEAVKSLPGGNTRSLLHAAPFPVFIKHGEGYKLTSEDGHVYTDMMGEMTAGLFGHSQPLIQAALINTIQTVGLNLGATTKAEAQLASLLCSRYNLDLIRFTNSGTEANLYAIQAAKRFTGKRKVVVFTGAYHGGCFLFVGDKPGEMVIDREEWIVAEYNDIEDTKRRIEESDDVAVVLVEGIQGQGPCLEGSHEFLHQIQTSARKVGAVFILDEVQTSRLSSGGLQKLEGLEPDMTTMGKFLGGGITFGCFGGRKDIMSIYDPRSANALPHSGTFNNNTLSLAAGYTGMSQVYTPEVARDFNAMGDKFREKLQDLSQGTKLTVTGRGTLLGLHFLKDGRKELRSFRDREVEPELGELFWLEMMERGFWTARKGCVNVILGTPWEELERFVECVGEFLRKYDGLMKL